jgi:hypothetical protein
MPLKKEAFLQVIYILSRPTSKDCIFTGNFSKRVINLEINGCYSFLRENFAFFRIKDVNKCRRCFPGFLRHFFCLPARIERMWRRVVLSRLFRSFTTRLLNSLHLANTCMDIAYWYLVLTKSNNQRKSKRKTGKNFTPHPETTFFT